MNLRLHGTHLHNQIPFLLNHSYLLMLITYFYNVNVPRPYF